MHPGLQMMRDVLLLLRNLTSAGPALRVLSWGHSAAPELLVEPPESLEEIVVEPDGFLEENFLIARYRLHGAQPKRTRYTAVRGTANIAIDAAVNVDPPPQEPDDTLTGAPSSWLASSTGWSARWSARWDCATTCPHRPGHPPTPDCESVRRRHLGHRRPTVRPP